MEKLVEEMRYLELGSFEGEWEEHEKLDDWMMKAQEYGVLIDEDELMGDVNARDSENDMKDSARNIDIDIGRCLAPLDSRKKYWGFDQNNPRNFIFGGGY